MVRSRFTARVWEQLSGVVSAVQVEVGVDLSLQVASVKRSYHEQETANLSRSSTDGRQAQQHGAAAAATAAWPAEQHCHPQKAAGSVRQILHPAGDEYLIYTVWAMRSFAFKEASFAQHHPAVSGQWCGSVMPLLHQLQCNTLVAVCPFLSNVQAALDTYDELPSEGVAQLFMQRRSAVLELLTHGQLLFVLANSGLCSVFSMGLPQTRRLAYLNAGPHDIIRSIVLNDVDGSVLAVSFHATDTASPHQLHCRSVPANRR
eukprot:GHRQ01021089.1.p1 GENE.GHRQ01021089.1~~GHRQ01021089.1.p1  ORF type:complete len:260 (+),score=52.75 GHRQ01021089.1:317-1096(+)